MGAGKDTLAALIARRGFAVRRFAAPLWEAAAIVAAEAAVGDKRQAVTLAAPAELNSRLERAIEMVTGARAAPGVAAAAVTVLTAEPLTVGRLLQLLGTECFRELVGPDCFVECFARRWQAEGRPNVVLADVRFANEAAAVRACGGKIVLVLRPGSPGRADGRDAAHVSEAGVTDADAIVVNDGTLHGLESALAAAWPALCQQKFIQRVDTVCQRCNDV